MSANSQQWDQMTEAQRAAQRARIDEIVARFIAERDEQARRAVNPLTGERATADPPDRQRRDGGG